MINIFTTAIIGILDKFISDKDTKNKLAHEIATITDKHAHEIALKQIELNKTDATFGGVYRAGWRPLVGWICASALLWHFIIQPIVVFSLTMNGMETTLPEFDMASLMTVLLGMLGLGGLRTFEKSKGIK